MTKTINGNSLVCINSTNYNGVLVIGVVHGDEPQGEYLINEYLKHNKNSKLAFIPSLNPDGKEKNTRYNANKVDINRNFPTKNWQKTEQNEFFGGEFPASEIETKFLINLVENIKPRLILTIHSPFKIVNYDGNALNIAHMISEIIKYPVQKNIGYPTPGSFGTWAGIEKGIPTITLELDDKVSQESLIKPIFKIFNKLENF